MSDEETLKWIKAVRFDIEQEKEELRKLQLKEIWLLKKMGGQ